MSSRAGRKPRDQNPPRAPRPGEETKAPKIEDHPFLDPNVCGYILDPEEVTARIAQVEEELLTSRARHQIRRDVRHGFIKPGTLHRALNESRTYTRIVPCLDKAPKVHQRFYQLAARLWSSGKLGPRPR